MSSAGLPGACCIRRAASRPGASRRSTWRARLLADLVDDLGFDDDSVGTVVDLVDQVNTLRRQLDLLGQAIAGQPAETREAIARALARLTAKG